jgi:hypothetical protein
MDQSISKTAEKTLIVSDHEIGILSDMFEKTYAKTYNSTVKKAADEEKVDDQSFGITEFEKKQY